MHFEINQYFCLDASLSVVSKYVRAIEGIIIINVYLVLHKHLNISQIANLTLLDWRYVLLLYNMS